MSPNPMSRTPRNRRPVRRRAGFRRAATLAATTALLGGGVALSGPALAKLGAAATAVSLPGTFDSAIGCSGDWQPACAQAQMAVQADGRWKATLNLPAGSYSYKVAIRRRRQSDRRRVQGVVACGNLDQGSEHQRRHVRDRHVL
jgi:pullulanase